MLALVSSIEYSSERTYQWFWVISPRSSMARHDVHDMTESTPGLQMRWPQMTYLRLSEARLFMTHSAICLPELVGI